MLTIEEIDEEIARRERRDQLARQLDAEILRRRQNQDIGPFQSAAIAAGRGLTNIARGVGLAEPEAPAVTRAFEGLKAERPISTMVGQIAGEAAPFLVPGLGLGAIPAAGARAAATAALGAVEGGLISRGERRGGSEQILSAGLGGIIAGTFELALPRISRIGRQVIRRVKGRNPTGAIVDAAGNPTDEFIDALRMEGRSFDDVVRQVNNELIDEGLNPDQVARKAFLESQGLEPTRAQVTRTAADFQAQQEAAKTSSRALTALQRQEAVLTSRFDNAVLDTGGRASTPTSTVTDALVSKATVLDQEISDLYKVAREAAPGTKNVRFTSLTENLRKLAPTNRRTGGNIEAVVGDMQSKGILDKNMKVVGMVDVEVAEDLRKLMNELFDAQNSFGNGVLRNLKDTLDDDVFRAAGQDVFSQGRTAKRNFERELTRAKISKFDSRKSNLVRDVLENKIDPDRFTNSVVFSKKYRASDLQQLKDYISTTPNGKSAFNDLRAEALNEIKNRSFIGEIDEIGNRALSRAKLQSSIDAIGVNKLKVLFDEGERKFLRDMLEVAKIRAPVPRTALGRGPSAQAVGRIESALKSNPIFGFLISIIDFDSAGRAVLKSSVERATQEIGPSFARQAISLGAAAGGVALVGEQ